MNGQLLDWRQLHAIQLLSLFQSALPNGLIDEEKESWRRMEPQSKQREWNERGIVWFGEERTSRNAKVELMKLLMEAALFLNDESNPFLLFLSCGLMAEALRNAPQWKREREEKGLVDSWKKRISLWVKRMKLSLRPSLSEWSEEKRKRRERELNERNAAPSHLQWRGKWMNEINWAAFMERAKLKRVNGGRWSSLWEEMENNQQLSSFQPPSAINSIRDKLANCEIDLLWLKWKRMLLNWRKNKNYYNSTLWSIY